MKYATPSVQIVQTEILSDNWYTLRKITFEIEKPDGTTAAKPMTAVTALLFFSITNHKTP